MKLLYFAPMIQGGIADYAWEQVSALARRGVRVDLLCAPGFPRTQLASGGRIETLLPHTTRLPHDRRIRRALRFLRLTLHNYRRLKSTVIEREHTHVLFSAHGEFLAPLWAGAFRQLANRGVRFSAVVHDPVRNTVRGPLWWRRRSVSSAYSFLSIAYIHEQVDLETFGPMPALTTTVLPHGPYRIRTTHPPREAARKHFNLPVDKPVALVFGHLRDNKNLDLTIRALADVPDMHLLVAGKEMATGHKSARHYVQTARENGLRNRCRWKIGYIAEAEIGTCFAAADFVSLNYDGGFRSASGVLNLASQFRKPCLVGTGEGPLRDLVERYGLGVSVEPDSVAAISNGMRAMVSDPPRPRWDDYDRENSWDENARVVTETIFGA